MTFTIYDDNKTDVLTTNNLTEAYNFLVANIPPPHLCTFEQLQNEIEHWQKDDGLRPYYGFYVDEPNKRIYQLRVTYA